LRTKKGSVKAPFFIIVYYCQDYNDAKKHDRNGLLTNI